MEVAKGYIHVRRTELSSLGEYPICLCYFYPITLCLNNLYPNVLVNFTTDGISSLVTKNRTNL